MSKDSRARMVRSAATLIRTRGVSGTSLSDVLAHSGAPRGSIYHHFPQGKEQLAADAIRWTCGAAGCVVAGVAIDTAAGEPGLIDVVRETFRTWVDLLSEQLVAVGVPGHRATPIALATVAGMEGALILCRAEGDIGPLETVAAELMRLLPPEPATAPPSR